MAPSLTVGKLISSLKASSLKLKIGFSIFSFLTLLSIVEPVITNYVMIGKSAGGAYTPLLPISVNHPFGTDNFGRDVFALVIIGLKNSLFIGFLAGTISMVIAILTGFTAGYKSGRTDQLITSITDALLVIPTLPIFLIIVYYAKIVDIVTMSLILAFFSWPWPTRMIRSQVLSLKERPFVDLAKMTGLNDFEIMFKELMPNFLPYLGIGFANGVLGALLAETGLRLLGLGPSQLITLGVLLQTYIAFGLLSLRMYHVILAPIIFLILLFVSLNLINVGLEETFNPRLKKITGI
jgi:peptide/nickel transport system permease protein